MQPVVRTVACPACGTPVEWQPQSRFRPFCSARCKEADIGAWASERYRVAGNDDNTEQDLNDPASSRT